MRPCGICSRPDVGQIERLLRAGNPLRAVVDAHPGVSKSALDRHRRHMAPSAVEPSEAAGAPASAPETPVPASAAPAPSFDALAVELEAAVAEQIARVRTAPDLTPAARSRLLASACTQLQTAAKLTGRAREISDREAARLPQVRRMIRRLVEVLAAYPDALKATVDAMQAIEDEAR